MCDIKKHDTKFKVLISNLKSAQKITKKSIDFLMCICSSKNMSKNSTVPIAATDPADVRTTLLFKRIYFILLRQPKC